jgi:hypothetical protein
MHVHRVGDQQRSTHASDSLLVLTTRYLSQSQRTFLSYMPESREAEAHRKMVMNIYEHLKASGTDFHLLGIWADGTEKEQARAPIGSRLRDGHVYKLDPNSKILRGSRKSQTRVFPPMYAPKPRSSVLPPSIEELELKEIHSGARSMTMDFGNAFLQVRTYFYCTRSTC